jgi:hypothetical protein
MNAQEINKFLKSDAASEIIDLQFNLSFPIANIENTYNLYTLYRYVADQNKQWEVYDALPTELLESKNYFAIIQVRILQLIEKVKNGGSTYPHLGELQLAITQRSDFMIPADSTESSFLISVFKESSQLFEGAYAFLSGRINYSSFNNKEYLQGVLMSAIHKIGESPTINRTSHERTSFNSLKSRVEKFVTESDENFKGLFIDGNEKIKTHVVELEKMKNENQQKLDKWFQLNQSTAKDFTKEVTEERKNIEQTYKELLQLQAPAQHWKITAEKLLNEGHMFMRALFAFITLGALALYFLLWKTPEGMLESFFNGDKTSAIRWSIVFITFISFLFFGVQSLRKAMFSSFHLARDAQEREILTMYYLSLIKDGVVGNDDRNLILQSLFSRADSGLLKEDSSPAMPGIIDKFKTN